MKHGREAISIFLSGFLSAHREHAAFQRELSELLGCSVDVASVNGLKEQIRNSVMQEAVPL